MLVRIHYCQGIARYEGCSYKVTIHDIKLIWLILKVLVTTIDVLEHF